MTRRTAPAGSGVAFLYQLLLLVSASLLVNGCATPYQTAGLTVGLATATGSRAPAHELEQIYYVGVFDPEEQLPPTVYRLTVRGQVSLLSSTKFASGWVPAGVIDSLNGRIGLDAYGSGDVEFTQTNKHYNVNLKTGRRLMMFGPEGFREAPRNHRLVLVMGAKPLLVQLRDHLEVASWTPHPVKTGHGAEDQRQHNSSLQENLVRFRANDWYWAGFMAASSGRDQRLQNEHAIRVNDILVLYDDQTPETLATLVVRGAEIYKRF